MPRIDRANPFADTAMIGYCTQEQLEDGINDTSPRAEMKAEAEDSHPPEPSNLLHMGPNCDKSHAAKRDCYSLRIN